MMHELGKELEAALVLKGCPFRVKDRESHKPTAHRNVIVIEHDGGDTFSPPKSQSGPNVDASAPKRWYLRTVGGKLTIYAQSTKAAATEWEHRRLAEHVLDLSLVALRTVCTNGDRRAQFVPGRGQFIELEDLEASEVKGGAVYELGFTVDRAVEERDWDGSLTGFVTIEPDMVQTTTHVSLANGPDDDDDESTPPATADIV